MNKDKPGLVQQVVAAGNGEQREGSARSPERAVAAEVTAVELRRIIARRIREARGLRMMLLGYGYELGSKHCEGRICALVHLAREVCAKPRKQAPSGNDQALRPAAGGPSDVSAARTAGSQQRVGSRTGAALVPEVEREAGAEPGETNL